MKNEGEVDPTGVAEERGAANLQLRARLQGWRIKVKLRVKEKGGRKEAVPVD